LATRLRNNARNKLADGRWFRILTVVDQFTRECVCLEAERSMTGIRVAQALEAAKIARGSLPESVTVDNGSEFCSRALEAWAMGNSVPFYAVRRALTPRFSSVA
jgi:putative transposase